MLRHEETLSFGGKTVKVKIVTLVVSTFLFMASAAGSRAQEVGPQDTQTGAGDVRTGETRVPLAQVAVAFDAAGGEALGGNLLTQALVGAPDSPVRNTRIVIENRSADFYNYATGWATFYGEDGVRCGEGLWNLEAVAPRERVEVDTPGLRLTCTPASWRLVATTLLTRTGDAAKPRQGTPPPARAGVAPTGEAVIPEVPAAPAIPALEINVNGKTIPVQIGNPLEILVGKERVRIVIQPAP